MPTYTYRRPDGTTFDLFQRISDNALTVDPETGVPVKRVISGGAGLQFKGDGFYITDYTSKGKEPKKASTESASESGEKPAESKEKKAAPAAPKSE